MLFLKLFILYWGIAPSHWRMRWLDAAGAMNIASEVAQSCLTLCDAMDCSPPTSSIHGIFQARVLEWVAFSFSRGSSRPREQTQVSWTAGWRFTLWATREAMSMNLGRYWEVVRDREAWHAAIHWVTKSQIQLGKWTTIVNDLLIFHWMKTLVWSGLLRLKPAYRVGLIPGE